MRLKELTRGRYLVFLITLVILGSLIFKAQFPLENTNKIYPKKVIHTFYDDYKLANTTAAFLIKTYKPLTEKQILILRELGVRELSTSEIETIYHALIEEERVKDVKDLDFVEDVYPYKTK